MKNHKWEFIQNRKDDNELKFNLMTMHQNSDTITSLGIVLLNNKKVGTVTLDHPDWPGFFKKPRKKRIPIRQLTYALAHKTLYALNGGSKGKKYIDRKVAQLFGIEDDRNVLRARNQYLKKWLPADIIEIFIDGRARKHPSAFIIILEPEKCDISNIGNDPFIYNGKFMMWNDGMKPEENLLIESGEITAQFDQLPDKKKTQHHKEHDVFYYDPAT